MSLSIHAFVETFHCLECARTNGKELAFRIRQIAQLEAKVAELVRAVLNSDKRTADVQASADNWQSMYEYTLRNYNSVFEDRGTMGLAMRRLESEVAALLREAEPFIRHSITCATEWLAEDEHPVCGCGLVGLKAKIQEALK